MILVLILVQHTHIWFLIRNIEQRGQNKAMASGRRCYYEVLGLQRDCTADEIRSAYKKLALQRHPDKLVQSGLSKSEATAQFQELSQAYEVLSDPKERSWYDSHRSQILFADPNSANSVPDSVIPNLFSFFSNTVFSGYSDSGRGFYKVYSDVFNKIYANEINFAVKLGLGSGSVREAPAMGNLDSPYDQVNAFYSFWLGFSTVMDFFWVDAYDAMAGINRKSRRVMEEENKKLRKKAKREYNETVRGLAEFVKKRDKRVLDMAMKKNLEAEKKRQEEKERKKKMERERLERAMAYEEPEWAQVVEEEEEDQRNVFEELDEKKKKKDAEGNKELYCVMCGKKFKSEKQWKNHEQSKKHRDKVVEFRESIGEEEIDGIMEGVARRDDVDEIEGLGDRVRDDFQIGEEIKMSERDEFYDVHSTDMGEESVSDKFVSGNDDEIEEENGGGEGDEENVVDLVEAMIAGCRNKNNVGANLDDFAPSSSNLHAENDSNEAECMDYNNRKSGRRNRGARKQRKRNNGEDEKGHMNGTGNDWNGERNRINESHVDESSFLSLRDDESSGKGDGVARNKKTSNQPVDKRGTSKKETKTKSKNMSKGTKTKVILLSYKYL